MSSSVHIYIEFELAIALKTKVVHAHGYDCGHCLGAFTIIAMRRFFAHTDQRAVVMYILGCLSLIEHAHG